VLPGHGKLATEPGLQADSLPPCARVLRRCGAQTVLKKVEAEGLVAVRRGGHVPGRQDTLFEYVF